MSEVLVTLPPEKKSSRWGVWLFVVMTVALSVLLAVSVWGDTNAAPKSDLATVTRGEIINKTQATGRVVPREEVFVRSLVAGVLVELQVLAGQRVKKGEHLATIKVVADPVALSDANTQVRAAEARLATATREVERMRNLQNSTGLTAKELAVTQDEKRLAEDALNAAKERLKLISQGTSGTNGQRSTRIVSPVDGTILALPVALGDFVSETNSYRDGTTIAIVADMGKLLFKGQIEEAHVGRLKVGMPASVRIGAIPNELSKGKLTWIAPRATIESAAGGGSASSPSSVLSPLSSSAAGITRFELWVELIDPPANVRAGYSASAELELERKNNVLLVNEGALHFDGGKAFAKVHTATGKDEQRELKVGISDGLHIEVVSGLNEGDKLAAWEAPKT
jgi:HlyD family secretion protein